MPRLAIWIGRRSGCITGDASIVTAALVLDARAEVNRQVLRRWPVPAFPPLILIFLTTPCATEPRRLEEVSASPCTLEEPTLDGSSSPVWEVSRGKCSKASAVHVNEACNDACAPRQTQTEGQARIAAPLVIADSLCGTPHGVADA